MSRRIIEKFIYIAFAAAGFITTIAITVSDFVFGYDTTFIKYGGIIACAVYSLYTAVKGRISTEFRRLSSRRVFISREFISKKENSLSFRLR